MLAGRDLLGGAQTGTGKTAGFTLPMLQRLAAHANTSAVAGAAPDPRADPHADARARGAGRGERPHLRQAPARCGRRVVYGGVGINPQIDALRRGVDILVATPGRLLDHVQQKTVDLRQVEILVLDEADRMLDMGFIRDIRRILALLPAKRQNLLFSATFSGRDPQARRVAPARSGARSRSRGATAESELVAQRVHPVAQGPQARAARAPRADPATGTRCWCSRAPSTARTASREQLVRDGIEADAIHGNKSQGARTRRSPRFKDGTSARAGRDRHRRARPRHRGAAARGELRPAARRPRTTCTASAAPAAPAASGEAISLVAPEENGLLKDIEKLLKRQLVREAVPGFEPGAATAPQTPPARREQPGRRTHDGEQRRNHAAPDAQHRRGNTHAAPRHAAQMRPIGAAHSAAPAHAAAPAHPAAPARPVAPARPAGQARSEPHVPALLRGTTRRAG